MNDHIVIVGASSPLATSTTQAFLARGEKVSLIGRSCPPSIADLQLAGKVVFYSFDLESYNAVPRLVKNVAKEGGQITRLCFFQRYRGGKDPWAGEYAVSLRATEKIIDEFGSQSSSADDRSVVIISSPADSSVALEQPLSYHVAKAGLGQMIKYYASVLGPAGIRVNGVRPAIVLKPRAKAFYDKNKELVALFNRVTPLGRMGCPSDIANAVVFLSSNEASFITGQILSVDGGLSVHERASLARLAASGFNKKLVDARWKQK